jgi:hypothetical protein
MKRRPYLDAMLLVGVLAMASCRQIAGIQDLPRPCADPLTIDDMEDGDGLICETNGRHGGWFSFGDGTSSNEMFSVSAISGRGSSRRAVHFTGGGFTDWGAILGLNLNSDGISRHAYQAPGVGGLTFWMKSTAPVTVEALTEATVLVDNGGQCDGNVSPNGCNDHFAFQITQPDSGWKQYEVPFSALRQIAGGTATWDPSQLIGVQFLVGPGVGFDVWIDDVAFYYCATPECRPTCSDPKFPVSCAKDAVHPAACFPPAAMCDAVDTWCADPNVLDDMEDGDTFICQTQGRQSGWYAYGDSKAQFEMAQIPGGRGASNYAAHVTGSHLTDWGAGVGFGLKASGRQTYDASAADGIAFWMKGPGIVTVHFRRPETTPPSNPPGTCANGDCDHHFGYNIDARGDQWAEYHVPFSALQQQGGGSGALTWDPTRLLAIEFAIHGSDFDFWIDDVRFYNCTGDACVPTCNTPELPMACAASASQTAACWPAGTDCSNPPDRYYTNVWGSGRNDVWIVGSTETSEVGHTLHWDGVNWTSASTNTPVIWAIWGSDADNAWLAGSRGTMRRRAGSNWIDASSGTATSLYQGMWGSGPNDVWASGAAGTIVHWDGNSWSPIQSPTTKDLWGLWTSSPSDGWAVGVDGTTLRLTASGWAAVASGTSVQLDGVWGSNPNDVWAVGDAGTIRHWNGSAWTGGFESGTTKYLDGVWGSDADDVWVVGESGTILRWNGSAWAMQPSGTNNYLGGVWGSGPDDVYVVGDLNTVLHWDGAHLTPITIDLRTP